MVKNAEKNNKIKKWKCIFSTNCPNCQKLNTLRFYFVHATNPDTGEIGPHEIDDYICTYVCNCKGTYMGNYVKKCSACNIKLPITEEEIDSL
jgi:hypothetical protein